MSNYLTLPVVPTTTTLCYLVLIISITTHSAVSFLSKSSTPVYRMQEGRVAGGNLHCNSPHPSYCSYSTSLQSSDQKQGTELSPTDTTDGIIVERPVIHWTVPIQKIGWRDEETGKWYDEDGPREGPPQNYWRQNLDQRAYNLDMNIVMKTVSHINAEDTVIDTVLDDAIKEVEEKNGVRFPSRHRNLLGTWAPIYLAGTKVAVSSSKGVRPVVSSSGGSQPVDDSAGLAIEVPMTVDIFRKAGRKFGPKNRYGTFDASLAVGEEVRLRTSDGTIDTTMCASEANEPVILGTTEIAGDNLRLQVGGVTYVSDYLLIQRNEEGALSDMWLRCDDAYLGKNTE